MGKIVTKGYASRKRTVDQTTINIDFYASEKQTKDAIKKVTEQCDAFLKIMETNGIDISKLIAGGTEVRRSTFADEREITAHRKIEIRAEYDLTLVDLVMKTVEQESFSANIDVEHDASYIAGLREELIVEATKEARKKADLLAEATGTRVVGVERIKFEPYDDYIFYDDEVALKEVTRYKTFNKCARIDNSLYSTLCAEEREDEAEVYVEWILEDK